MRNRAAEGEGLDLLLNFWEKEYLQEYIRDGGSKIKFVTGRSGSGKTYFLRQLTERAKADGYLTVHFSAEDIWLHDFRDVYLAILDQCDLEQCLRGCAGKIIRNMNQDEKDIPEGMTFMDYLSQKGIGDALNKFELRDQLRNMFMKNPLLDNNFAICCSLLTGGILGHPVLEQSGRELLLSWMKGDRTVKLSMLRSFGLAPVRITKYNARHMLRSLAEVVHLSGRAGLLVCIDDLEILADRQGNDRIHYTKMRREDTYESIRQLIDDIDTLRHLMVVYSFDRSLIDNDNAGLKSYQALWMRIQNEVVSRKFNCFADIVNLDFFAEQEYTPAYLVKMSESFAAAEGRPGNMEGSDETEPVRNQDEEDRMAENTYPAAITLKMAEEILEESRLSSTGIPALVRQRTTAPETGQTKTSGSGSNC